MNLFFHLFKCRRGLEAQTQSSGLISLEMSMSGFGPLPELQPFVDHFFLVIPIGSKAHDIVSSIGDKVDVRCARIFPKY